MEKLILSIVSLVLSAIAIAVSIVSCVYNNRETKRINNINIKARYFEKIFDDYLIYEIPKARKYIRFEKGKLADYQNYIDVLSNMRNAASFFKFDNKIFFDKLKEVTQDLENYLSDCGNKEFEYEEQADVYKVISEKTVSVYSLISDFYL